MNFLGFNRCLDCALNKQKCRGENISNPQTQPNPTVDGGFISIFCRGLFNKNFLAKGVRLDVSRWITFCGQD